MLDQQTEARFKRIELFLKVFPEVLGVALKEEIASVGRVGKMASDGGTLCLVEALRGDPAGSLLVIPLRNARASATMHFDRGVIRARGIHFDLGEFFVLFESDIAAQTRSAIVLATGVMMREAHRITLLSEGAARKALDTLGHEGAETLIRLLAACRRAIVS